MSNHQPLLPRKAPIMLNVSRKNVTGLRKVSGPARRQDAASESEIVLDSVLTIAVGDRDRFGNSMSPTEFDYFAHTIAQDARDCGGTVYAVTFGHGIGSDGVNDGEPERSAIILVGNVENVSRLRATVGYRLAEASCSSACFAQDAAHEPAFDTIDGRRP